MTRIRFSVPFVKGKARPRFYRGHVTTPRATKAAERLVANAYRLAGGTKAPADVGIVIVIDVYRPPMTKWRKRDGDGHLDLQKPDVDNVAKLVLDGLNGIAYEDDSQVNGLTILKHIRTYGNATETRVSVFWED